MKKYQGHYKPELHKTNIIHEIIREKSPGKSSLLLYYHEKDIETSPRY